MKHKIVIDSISLLSSLTGIGRYTYEISKYIQESDDFEAEFYYGYFSKKIINPHSHAKSKKFKSIITSKPIIKKIARKFLTVSSGFFSKKYDLYFEPNFIPIESIKARKVVTAVHDFSFLHYKNFHPKERIEYFENTFFKNIKNSDIIITGSKFTKKEIIEHLHFKDDEVKVIYHGINHRLFKLYHDLDLSFQLPKKFIFSAGSIEPRKNLLGLLNAYNSLNEEIKEEYHLVLAGFKGWNNIEIIRLIDSNRSYIHYLGYIADVELAKVYNLASLFVYPSFYEGFGLPPLEAMACGTPVITSNVSSLPEVGGDAVVYCDPFNVEDIKEKIEMVLSDEKLQQEMIQKGLKRAKEFTWKKSAQEHLRVFQEVLNS